MGNVIAVSLEDWRMGKQKAERGSLIFFNEVRPGGRVLARL